MYIDSDGFDMFWMHQSYVLLCCVICIYSIIWHYMPLYAIVVLGSCSPLSWLCTLVVFRTTLVWQQNMFFLLFFRRNRCRLDIIWSMSSNRRAAWRTSPLSGAHDGRSPRTGTRAACESRCCRPPASVATRMSERVVDVVKMMNEHGIVQNCYVGMVDIFYITHRIHVCHIW